MPSLYASHSHSVGLSSALPKYSFSSLGSPAVPASAAAPVQSSPLSAAPTVVRSSPASHASLSSASTPLTASVSRSPVSASSLAPTAVRSIPSAAEERYFSQQSKPLKSKKSLLSALNEDEPIQESREPSGSSAIAAANGIYIGDGAKLLETEEEIYILVPERKIVTTTTFRGSAEKSSETKEEIGQFKQVLSISKTEQKYQPNNQQQTKRESTVSSSDAAYSLSESRRLIALERRHLSEERDRLAERHAALTAQQSAWIESQQRHLDSERKAIEKSVRAKFSSELESLRSGLKVQNASFQREVAEIGRQFRKSREEREIKYQTEKGKWNQEKEKLQIENKKLNERVIGLEGEARLMKERMDQLAKELEKEISTGKSKDSAVKEKRTEKEDRGVQADIEVPVRSAAAAESRSVSTSEMAVSCDLNEFSDRERLLEEREDTLEQLEIELRTRLEMLNRKEEELSESEARRSAEQLENSVLFNRLKAWETDLKAFHQALNEREGNIKLRERHLSEYLSPFHDASMRRSQALRSPPPFEVPSFRLQSPAATPLPMHSLLAQSTSANAALRSETRGERMFTVSPSPSASPVPSASADVSVRSPASFPVDLFSAEESFNRSISNGTNLSSASLTSPGLLSSRSLYLS